MVRYKRLTPGVMFRPHLFLMLFVTIRHTFAAGTRIRGSNATNEAASRGHCEGSTAVSQAGRQRRCLCRRDNPAIRSDVWS